jgi:histidyl-tRNA synthetase
VSEGATKKEEKPRRFQAIRGTRDLLPPETALWNRVEQTAHEVFATFGFGEIRLPIFESTDLFARAVGGETDIVSKEMYTFEDHEFADLSSLRSTITYRNPDIQNLHSVHTYRDELHQFIEAFEAGLNQRKIPGTPENVRALENLRLHVARIEYVAQDWTGGLENAKARFYLQISGIREALRVIQFGDVLSLRPEATASVCRAYIEHGMQSLPQPVKLYYMGPMFRRERPQKGRYRQFYQIGAEILGGTDVPAIDAEVIEMLMAFFDKLGLEGTTLYINSIGCRQCRPKYVQALRAKLLEFRDRLGEDSKRRIETNPLRVLDSKAESEQEIIALLPKIVDYLCEDCRAHYTEVKRELDLRGVKYQENWRLVRGLDYYMRTTFEITAAGLGSQNAVCGGGRYDGLVELLGGPKGTKGIGFAIGEDRLILSLQHQGVKVPTAPDVLISWRDSNSQESAQRLAKILRSAGMRVELPSKAMDAREGLGLANKKGAAIGVLLGPDELVASIFTLRFLAGEEQLSIDQSRAPELGRFLLFRVLLEKALSRVAELHGITPRGRSIMQLGQELIERHLIPAHLIESLRRASAGLNKAVHGLELEPQDRSDTVAGSLSILRELADQYKLQIPEFRG